MWACSVRSSLAACHHHDHHYDHPSRRAVATRTCSRCRTFNLTCEMPDVFSGARRLPIPSMPWPQPLPFAVRAYARVRACVRVRVRGVRACVCVHCVRTCACACARVHGCLAPMLANRLSPRQGATLADHLALASVWSTLNLCAGFSFTGATMPASTYPNIPNCGGGPCPRLHCTPLCFYCRRF